MTQRPLTAAELADARVAYVKLGNLYNPTYCATEFVQACNLLARMMQNGTSDGQPLRTERVPTKDDIGKRVKVKSAFDAQWHRNYRFVGFCHGPRFAVESVMSRQISDWQYCIIEEAAQ
jgi:hypothetical protein